ncbi:MAG: hypothetical protein WBA77_01900 [Microcoleaceae cyanobacterium]
MALLSEGKDLEAFVEAIQAGKIWQKYRAIDPEVLGALIGNVYQGRERNRLREHDNKVNSVSISNANESQITHNQQLT